jgi:hypothetical protein
MTQDKIHYPPTFQDENIWPVVEHIITQECVSIVGVGTMGKTWFIKRLFEPDVLNYYYHNTGLTRDNMLFIRIDPNAMLFLDEKVFSLPPSWSGFELILSRLFEQIPNLQEQTAQIYKRTISENSISQLAALRQLEAALELLRDKDRIIIIFDEFELFYERMPASFFLNLRSLRDRFRYQLLFVTVSRTEMTNLPDTDKWLPDGGKVEQTESFLELFRDTVYLQAPSEEISDNQKAAGQRDSDALLLTRYLNQRIRRNQELKQTTANVLWTITGRHNGLMRTALQTLDTVWRGHGGRVDMAEVRRAYVYSVDMLRELYILFKSLTVHEQDFLLYYMQHGLNDETLNEYYSTIVSLLLKHILKVTHNDLPYPYSIEPPLFSDYLGNKAQLDRIRMRPSSSRRDIILPPPPPEFPPRR